MVQISDNFFHLHRSALTFAFNMSKLPSEVDAKFHIWFIIKYQSTTSHADKLNKIYLGRLKCVFLFPEKNISYLLMRFPKAIFSTGAYHCKELLPQLDIIKALRPTIKKRSVLGFISAQQHVKQCEQNH